MLNYRYFKGNVLGGFRLVDLNKTVRQGEYFFLDVRTASMSKATAGALKAKWMI